LEVGQPFASSISFCVSEADTGENESANQFMDTLRDSGVACGWELEVPVMGQPTTLRFTGGVTSDGLLIVGEAAHPEVTSLTEELIRINNETVNTLRAELKQATLTSPTLEGSDRGSHNDSDSELLIQLSRANNEVITAQRELVKNNVVLSRTNEALEEARAALEAKQAALEETNVLLERLVQEHRKAKEEAEENNRFKDRFISVVSHEMRTPLTSMFGWLSLLRLGALQEPAISTALDTLQRGADSLLRLINDLLDTERIRTGKIHLDKEPVNLVPVIANAIEAVRHRAEEKSISINMKTLVDNRVVLGDAARLEQILLNLLFNAVKFTPEGGSVEVCVNSHATEQGREVELTVSDTGKGIAPEFLPHVFDQFRQEEAADSRSYGGLGLGLYIVRELVDLHGGIIQAESDGAGTGATFRVRLPAAPRQ
jgi:signal transduction histidine kinase